MTNERSESEALARERIKQMLLKGEVLKADNTGRLVPANEPSAKNAINIPDGDLA